MIKITKEQMNILTKHINNVLEFVKNDDVDALLEAIDNEIINNMLGNDDEPDAKGINLQKVYDQVYNQN